MEQDEKLILELKKHNGEHDDVLKEYHKLDIPVREAALDSLITYKAGGALSNFQEKEKRLQELQNNRDRVLLTHRKEREKIIASIEALTSPVISDFVSKLNEKVEVFMKKGDAEGMQKLRALIEKLRGMGVCPISEIKKEIERCRRVLFDEC
jgi:hypothetical protein